MSAVSIEYTSLNTTKVIVTKNIDEKLFAEIPVLMLLGCEKI
jgi:hypothetical protein